ncbi:MAG: hypothetical protein WC371_02970 [Parachlamydiales bacterium]|jgi:hypothetical protein
MDGRFYRINRQETTGFSGFVGWTQSSKGQRRVFEVLQNIFRYLSQVFQKTAGNLRLKELAEGFALASSLSVFTSVWSNVKDLTYSLYELGEGLCSHERTVKKVLLQGEKVLYSGSYTARDLLFIVSLVVRVPFQILKRVLSFISPVLDIWDLRFDVAKLVEAAEKKKAPKTGASEADRLAAQKFTDEAFYHVLADVLFDLLDLLATLSGLAALVVFGSVPGLLEIVILVVGFITLVGSCANKIHGNISSGSLEEVKDSQEILSLQNQLSALPA